MKVYINREPIHGPWGGGAKTVNKLALTLEEKGHEVVYKLQPGIEKIFCFDPRPNKYGEGISHLFEYKTKHSTKIIQRIGDIGTHSKPKLARLVQACLDKSDYFIFPSEWAKQGIDFTGSNCEVIYNSPMGEFYLHRNADDIPSQVPRIVTHHWSPNSKKGFKMYQKFDAYCQSTGKFEFYYIGQKPWGCRFKNYQSPLNVNQLIQILPTYDIYLTASEEEAGANHVLEAMASGLPVAYRDNGGSIPEYCHKYGIEYSDFAGLVASVQEMAKNYATFKQRVLEYDCNNTTTIEQYCKIIERI